MRSRAARIEWIALAAALVPFVVALVRAAVQHWMPVGDAAYFTVRSRDVLTSHTPLVGAWSSGSSVVGIPVNNLGPLQLDLLAPFTKLSPYLGTGVGSAVINAGSIVTVWIAARHLLTPGRVALVMAGTTLFMGTLGLSWMIDARQQHAMVLPFYALLWTSAAMWAGDGRAVALGAVLGSLTLQTHFTYAYQSILVLGAGCVGYVSATRGHQRRARRRTAIITATALALCWAQPVLDQLFGTGNIGKVLGPVRRGQSGAGVGTGVQILAGGSLVPPLWLPGSMDDFLLPHDGVSTAGAVTAVLFWTAAAGVVAAIGLRQRSRAIAAIGLACLVALGSGLIGASAIPVSMFGLVPQNYYWVWSVGAFVTIALLAGASCAPLAWFRQPRDFPNRFGPEMHQIGWGKRVVGHPVVVPVALAVTLAVTLAIAVWPRYPVDWVRRDEAETDRTGRPLAAALREALRSGTVGDTVQVDLSRAFFGNNYPFVILVELQRAGVEFRFPPGSGNLARFGESRCAEAGRYQRLLLIVGRDPVLTPGSVVLAEVAGITSDELAEYADLQEHFGRMLRQGTVTVDVDLVRAVLGDPVDKLLEVQRSADRSAGGLARSLEEWRSWGYVEIPSSERGAFDRWLDLERRSSADFQTVVLDKPAPDTGETC